MSKERDSDSTPHKERRSWKVYLTATAVVAAPLFFGVKWIADGVEDATGDFYEKHPVIKEAVDTRSDFEIRVNDALEHNDYNGLNDVIKTLPAVIEAQAIIDEYKGELPDPVGKICSGVALSALGLLVGAIPITASDELKKLKML